MDNQQSIDWSLCLSLANHNEVFAKELLTMLKKDLPESRDAILKAHQTGDTQALKHHVHKLHGACCYVGVPNLKEHLAGFETHLKENPKKDAQPHINKITAEIDRIMTDLEDEKYTQ